MPRLRAPFRVLFVGLLTAGLAIGGGLVIAAPAVADTVTATIPSPNADTVGITPDGSKLYVPSSDGNIRVYRTSDRVLVATIATGSIGYGVTFNAGGTRAYVTSLFNNTITVINTSDDSVVTTIPTLDKPFMLAITPDGTKMYVTNDDVDSVSVIDLAINQITSTFTVGFGPSGIVITPDGTTAYIVHGYSAVDVVRLSDNTVTNTITPGTSPIAIAISPDGSTVYVANYDSADVSVISTATETVIATIPVGANPQGVDVSSDGSTVVTSNAGAGTLSVISTADNSLIRTITVGAGASWGVFAKNSNTFYVANENANSVSVASIDLYPVFAPATASTASATTGRAFRLAIAATNSPVFSLTGAPAGLAIDPATGVITGTPTATGTFAARVLATNGLSIATTDLAFTVAAGTVTAVVAADTGTVTASELAATGASVTPIASIGGILLVLGILALAGAAVTSRRRSIR